MLWYCKSFASIAPAIRTLEGYAQCIVYAVPHQTLGVVVKKGSLNLRLSSSGKTFKVTEADLVTIIVI